MLISLLLSLVSGLGYDVFEQNVFTEINRARTHPEEYYEEMVAQRDMLVWDGGLLYHCMHSTTFNGTTMPASDCAIHGGTLNYVSS